jgi:hypothetical protein
MAKPKLLSPSEFQAIRGKLEQILSEALEKERLDTALPESGSDPLSDLDELPPIDSKSVVKLSPLVREMTGHRLDPRWIRKGGYETVVDAITDLLTHFEKHCVGTDPTNPVTQVKPVAVVP